VDARLVTRERDPVDGRVAWVRITAEGAKVLHRGRRRKEAYLAKRLRSLDAERLAVLERATGILEELVEGQP